MKLLLHIGPYKTGSSAIQKALSSGRLGKIEYCRINAKNANEIPLLIYQGRVKELVAILNKAVVSATANNKNCVLISAETLWFPDEFYRIHDVDSNIDFERTFIELCLTIFEKLELIMVDREPMEVSKSLYRQVVRDVSSYDENWNSFNCDFHKIFNFENVILRWKHPGVSKIHKIKYNRDTLLLDFGKLINEKLDFSIQDNVSLSLRTDTIKYLLNSRKEKKLIRIVKWRVVTGLQPVYILDLVKLGSLFFVFKVVIKETAYYIYKELK